MTINRNWSGVRNLYILSSAVQSLQNTRTTCCRITATTMPSGVRHPSAESEPRLSSLEPGRPRPRHLGWLKTAFLVLVAMAVARTMLVRRQGFSGGIAGQGVRGSSSASFEAQRRRPRAAVCFFGLTRSLRWTLPSLQKRLLEVLRNGGMAVDVFVHTYSLLEVCIQKACCVVGVCAACTWTTTLTRDERPAAHRFDASSSCQRCAYAHRVLLHSGRRVVVR